MTTSVVRKTVDLRSLVVSLDKNHKAPVVEYTFGGKRQFYDKPRGPRIY